MNQRPAALRPLIVVVLAGLALVGIWTAIRRLNTGAASSHETSGQGSSSPIEVDRAAGLPPKAPKLVAASGKRGELRISVVDLQSGAPAGQPLQIVAKRQGAPLAIGAAWEHAAACPAGANPCHLENLDNGIYRVTASAGGRASASRVVSVRSDSQTVRLYLRSSALALRGKVVTRDGGPVRAATVSAVLRAEKALGDGHQEESTTDEGGAFALSLAAGTYEVRADAGPRGSVVEQVVLTGDRELVLRLAPGSTLRGRVVKQDSPVPGAQVIAYATGSFRETQTRAQADGVFTFTGLPSDTYTVTAIADRWRGRTDEVIPLRDGEEREGIVVHLSDGFRVSGALRTRATDKSLAGQVTLVDNTAVREPKSRAESAPDGSFELGPIAAGIYRLFASVDGFAMTSKEITVAGDLTDVSLELEPLLRVEGVVRSARGETVEAAEVTLKLTYTPDVLGKLSWPAQRVTDSDQRGLFVFDNVPRGKDAVLEASHPQHGSVVYLLGEVDATLRQKLELKLAQPTVLRGSVRSREGAVLSGIQVGWQMVSARRKGVTSADERGLFEIKVAVPPDGDEIAIAPVRDGQNLIRGEVARRAVQPGEVVEGIQVRVTSP
jgi:hypothetical protein